MSLDELIAYFKELEIDKELDFNNKVRIQRAIETHLSNEETEALPKLVADQICNIGLTSNRECLYNRVDLWVETMWQNGLLDETERLVSKYGDQNIKLQGIVYKTVVSFLDNKLTQEEAIQRIKFDLHAYIRRQQTWFKKNKDILWFDVSDKEHVTKITEHVSNFLKC